MGRDRPRRQRQAVGGYSDGPLRRRPPEEIRYGTGRTALGHLLVALSEAGVASIIIRSTAAKMLPELRERFPKAELIHDERGCRALVAKVVKYVAAPKGCLVLELDLRGTELQKKVWQEVARIPAGKAMSYAEVAAALGVPKAVRAVASACSRCWHTMAVPCHRVLHGAAAASVRRDPMHARRYGWFDYEARLQQGRKRP